MAKIADEVCRSLIPFERHANKPLSIRQYCMLFRIHIRHAISLCRARGSPLLRPAQPVCMAGYCSWGARFHELHVSTLHSTSKMYSRNTIKRQACKRAVKSAHLPIACAQQNGLHPCAQDAYASLAKKEGMIDSPPSMVLLGRRRNAYFTSLQPCTIREGLA